jgi:predicted glutamine amidotransferase
MSAEDLERYEADRELQLYQEYKDVLGMFQYAIETERRFYLANKFDLQVRNQDGDTYFDITLHDAWVWDMYRPARFVKTVRVLTFKDVNIEELEKPELEMPDTKQGF